MSGILAQIRIYLVIFRNLCFLLALFLSATIIKFFSKQIRYPSLIVHSLSYDQAFLKSSPRELALFIREKRFSKYFDTSKVLWEVRSWSPRRIITPGFTYDTSLYLFTRCNSWKSIFLTARKIINLKALSTIFKQGHLKDVYIEGFQKLVWNVT